MEAELTGQLNGSFSWSDAALDTNSRGGLASTSIYEHSGIVKSHVLPLVVLRCPVAKTVTLQHFTAAETLGSAARRR